MLDDTSASLAVEITGVTLIFLLLLPSIHRIFKFTRIRSKKESHGVYEDVDGAATEKSQAEYSTKYAQIAVCITSVLGLATSIASAVMSTMRHANIRAYMITITLDWLLSVAWVSSFHTLLHSVVTDTYFCPSLPRVSSLLFISKLCLFFSCSIRETRDMGIFAAKFF